MLHSRTVGQWGVVGLQVTGALLFITALLYLLASSILHSSLSYPMLLVDDPSLAKALVTQASGATSLGSIGLVVCGLLLAAISLTLASHVAPSSAARVVAPGALAGLCWAIGGLLLLILASLWTGLAGVVHPLALVAFICSNLIAPLLLLFWTRALAHQFGLSLWLSRLSYIGLCLVSLGAVVWIINAMLPVEAGFYGLGGLLGLLALIGESIWLTWLVVLSFRLMRGRASPGESPTMPAWHRHAHLGRRLALGVVGAAFVIGRVGLMMVGSPVVEADALPAEPSYLGTVIYMATFGYLHLSPIETVAQMRAANRPRTTPSQLPSGVSLQEVDAAGVPAQMIRAPGAGKDRAILYLHGGGFAVPLQDQDRVFAAQLSQAMAAFVLLPEYRLAPEHPFPAGLDDAVAAYHWLRSQGIAASRIVVVGESAGGNLALAVPLKLHQAGEAPPAAVIAMSAPTDLTMSGDTYRTKAMVDPILGGNLPRNAYAAYTNNGAVDNRDPLLSPLYGDLHGYPPTLLQVGTQEVLLSDATRMASRLQAAGDEVKLEVWPGMFHGWQTTGRLPEARLAVQHAVNYMRPYLR